ncbi:MAG: sigma-70 family RNA polymerase sigma factor [bacterium]|nr:sigma-70 family RNA polymerase sigma factor [bacterium]
MLQVSEERLFERYRRRRDAGSLARLFDRTAPALMRLALHLCRDRHAAEDVVQQTFLTAIERADRWDRDRGLFPWLVGILTNRARLHQRAERREPDADRLSGRRSETPADAAASRELEAAVEEAITELGDTYRPVLHLHLFHGLNAKEIGAALGRPAGSVRTQLVRALERLRRALPVGLGGATALALATTATAAVRQRVLSAFSPHLTAGAAGTASLWLGGSMMKKWLLLVPIACVAVLVYWQTDTVPNDVQPNGPRAGVDHAAVELPDEPETAATAATNEPGPGERSEAGPNHTPTPDTGSLVVTLDFDDEELSPLGIYVRMRPEPWTRGGQRFGARTDPAGQVRFDGIQPGAWLVEAEGGSLTAQSKLQIEAGREHEKILPIERPVRVRVQVIDEMRRPIPDAEVWVCMQYYGRVWPMEATTRLAARTDSNGRATVPAGTMSLVGARKTGYAASAATKASAAAGEEVRLMLTRGPGAIRGSVVDDDGRPVAGAAVYASVRSSSARGVSRAADGQAGETPASVYTTAGEDGSFAIEGLPANTYQILGIARGVLDVHQEIDVRAFEATTTRLEMRRSVPINVRTTRPDGTPIGGLLVYGRDPQGTLVGGGSITDKNGVFTFAAPRAGYHIEVKRDRQLLAERRSDAPLTGPAAVDIVIDEHLIVRGRLVDEQGEPVAGWRIVAVPDNTNEQDLQRTLALAFDSRTATDGSFEIWGELNQTVQVATNARSMTPRDLIRKRNIRVGTDDLDIVVPVGMLPRSVLTGRVVDTRGRPVKGATVQSTDFGSKPRECTGGILRITDLRHGKRTFGIAAPGYGSQRLELEIRAAKTDVGDIVLQRAVELRVRPVFPADTEWLGPLPRASVRTPAGRSIWPQPEQRVEDGMLVFNYLPPGKYLLHPHYEEQIATDPVPFELLAGVPLRLDWPVRVGRKRIVRFIPTPDQPALPDALLKVTIKGDNDEVVVDREVKSWQGKWNLRHTFVPGSYRATAKSATGHRFEGRFEVALDLLKNEKGSLVEIPVKR